MNRNYVLKVFLFLLVAFLGVVEVSASENISGDKQFFIRYEDEIHYLNIGDYEAFERILNIPTGAYPGIDGIKNMVMHENEVYAYSDYKLYYVVDGYLLIIDIDKEFSDFNLIIDQIFISDSQAYIVFYELKEDKQGYKILKINDLTSKNIEKSKIWDYVFGDEENIYYFEVLGQIIKMYENKAGVTELLGYINNIDSINPALIEDVEVNSDGEVVIKTMDYNSYDVIKCSE